MICRLFCEDYSGRGGGVPDLIIWNAKQGTCKFVEVKGPNDRLQENQKVLYLLRFLDYNAILTHFHVGLGLD